MGFLCSAWAFFALRGICSGENKKIGKKGENFTNCLKNWRDFGKIRGNFRRFCSEKKAIWKAIGRIFWCKKKFMIFQKNFDEKLIENNAGIFCKLL